MPATSGTRPRHHDDSAAPDLDSDNPLFGEGEGGVLTPQGGNNSATRGDSGPGSVEIKPALAITRIRADTGTKPSCYELQHANNPLTRTDSEDTTCVLDYA